MAISNFDKRLLIEQVRYMESKASQVFDAEQAFSERQATGGFEERLWRRARSLVTHLGLAQVTERANRLSRQFQTFAILIAALLGGVGITFTISNSHTINIYWLLLILLGFNLISIIFWLMGISVNILGLTKGALPVSFTGALIRMLSWLIYRGHRHTVDKHENNRSLSDETLTLIARQADRAWFAVNFSGAVGKWRLSVITHQLWLAYLISGLVFLVVLLMLRQYDFVWGTTLLSDDAFLKLTDSLSVPLNTLGFSTPTADQVQQTRIGVSQLLTAEHRYNWAQFLLGTLLCFGVLPRLLLLFFSFSMSANARRHFTLDFYLPYYIQLRQLLIPLASHGQIVDADEEPASKAYGGALASRMSTGESYEEQPATSVTGSAKSSSHQLPDETLWVAVELGDKASWPTAAVGAASNLGQVTDRESLALIQQQLLGKKCGVIAVAVSSARPPDRGLRRTVCQLMANSGQRWLVLLSDDQVAVSEARMAAWYRLAETCQVPAEHVISMRTA